MLQLVKGSWKDWYVSSCLSHLYPKLNLYRRGFQITSNRHRTPERDRATSPFCRLKNLINLPTHYQNSQGTSLYCSSRIYKGALERLPSGGLTQFCGERHSVACMAAIPDFFFACVRALVLVPVCFISRSIFEIAVSHLLRDVCRDQRTGNLVL